MSCQKLLRSHYHTKCDADSKDIKKDKSMTGKSATKKKENKLKKLALIVGEVIPLVMLNALVGAVLKLIKPITALIYLEKIKLKSKK